jgi:hypothetical protein
MDWKRCAVEHANYVRNASCIERGVGKLLLFGQDGLPDPLAMVEVEELGVKAYFGTGGYLNSPAVREEVRLLRRLCALKGIKELACVTDSRDGSSWALVVHAEEENETLAKILVIAHALAGKGSGASLAAVHTRYLQDLEVSVEELLKE